jgi:hypothetical protein
MNDSSNYVNEEDYKCSNGYDDMSQVDVEIIHTVLAAREREWWL